MTKQDTRTLIQYIPVPAAGYVAVPEPVALRIMARLATGRGPQIEGRCALVNGGRLFDGLAVIDDGAGLPATWGAVLAAPLEEQAAIDEDPALRGFFAAPNVAEVDDGAGIRWTRMGGGRSITAIRLTRVGAQDHMELQWVTPAPSRFIGALLASEGVGVD